MALADQLTPFFIMAFPREVNKRSPLTPMTNQTQELFDEFTPDPQLQQVTEYADLEFSHFIQWVMTLDERLTQSEATLVAAGIVHGLPQLLLNNPDALKYIRTGFEKLIAARKSHAE